MKIRNGFVSNSSSSSFIIGAAFVPSDKAKDLTLTNSRRSDAGFLTLDNLKDDHWYIDYCEETDTVIVANWAYDSVTVYDAAKRLAEDPGSVIVYVNGSGNEPEYNEDWGEYDYDSVDLDEEWFDDKQLEAASIITANGGHVSCGGGFNG